MLQYFHYLAAKKAQKNRTPDLVFEDKYIGGAEIQGKREAQEDSYVSQPLNPEQSQAYLNLDDVQREALLNNICAELSERFENEFSGSTGIMAIISPKDKSYHVANVGDSQILRVELGETPSCVRQNTLHNPSEPSERKRLEEAGAKIMRGRIARLYKSINISRTFGDCDFKDIGVISEPEVFKSTFAKKGFYLILACDGLTEKDCLNEAQILEKVKQAYQQQDMPLKELANDLAQTAVLKGSGDNVTVLITRPNHHKQEGIPYVMAVFDGHGGDEVSKSLAKHFMKCFDNQLRLLCGEMVEIDLNSSCESQAESPKRKAGIRYSHAL